MAGSEFSQGELEARCRDLARSLESSEDISAEAVAACLPQEPDAVEWWAWVQAYARLRVLHDQYQRPGGTNAATPDADDARVTEALRGAPKRLRLIGHTRVPGAPADEAVVEEAEVWVYPKGYLALLECHAMGARLAWLADRIFTLQQRAEGPDQVLLLERALEELAYLQRKFAWVATTPGPGLPYPEFPVAKVELPTTFNEWDGWDHLALGQAFQSVNAIKQPALDRLLVGVPSEDGQTLVNGWSVFFGSIAQELGEDTVRVMRDRPLVSLLATVRVSAGARAAAVEHARQQPRED